MAGKHSERDIYIAWVLWVIGMSETSIGAVLMKRRKQIAGLITRSPYANRSIMTDEERQAALDDLLLIRIGEDGRPVDRGALDGIPMKIIPLRETQRKGGTA